MESIQKRLGKQLMAKGLKAVRVGELLLDLPLLLAAQPMCEEESYLTRMM